MSLCEVGGHGEVTDVSISPGSSGTGRGRSITGIGLHAKVSNPCKILAVFISNKSSYSYPCVLFMFPCMYVAYSLLFLLSISTILSYLPKQRQTVSTPGSLAFVIMVKALPHLCPGIVLCNTECGGEGAHSCWIAQPSHTHCEGQACC